MSNIVIGSSHLAKELGKIGSWEVLAKTLIPFDFTNIKTYAIWIAEHNTVINTVDYEAFGLDLVDRQKMVDINFLSVIKLVDYCNQTYKKIVHFSTNDLSNNKDSWYSYTRQLAEGYVRFKANDYLIIRTSFKSDPNFYKTPCSNIGNVLFSRKIVEDAYPLIAEDATGLRVIPHDVFDVLSEIDKDIPRY